MAQAAAVVCSDSSANFIAPSVGTPFVTLLGPTRPERTGPYGELGKALAANVPCLGCLRRSCPHATCMQMIEPERVLAAMDRVMGDRTLKAV
jgi:ADP-heptose:LPS heptosyltransferase